MSWDEIGESLGMTRQSAWEYFSRPVRESLGSRVASSQLDDDEAMQLAVDETREVRPWRVVGGLREPGPFDHPCGLGSSRTLGLDLVESGIIGRAPRGGAFWTFGPGTGSRRRVDDVASGQ